MLRRICAATLLLLGAGVAAAAAVHESALLTEESAVMDYVAVAGCIQTIVSVRAFEQTLHSSGAPIQTRGATVDIQIQDICAGTVVLVANDTTSNPDYVQSDLASARFADEFTTADNHHVRIDVDWTAGDTTERRLERIDFASPDGKTHAFARLTSREAVIAGTLVIDGASTDLSGASGSLQQSTTHIDRVIH